MVALRSIDVTRLPAIARLIFAATLACMISTTRYARSISKLHDLDTINQASKEANNMNIARAICAIHPMPLSSLAPAP